MRGEEQTGGELFWYVSCEARVPEDHPLRTIRAIVDEALEVLSPSFERLYSRMGRPSIAPEKLLRALLLQAFYSIRSERQLMEQLDYNLLFRWFVELSADAPVWNPTVFSKNRDRLIEGEIAGQFLAAVLSRPRVKAPLSDEHFSVDGTLIEASASMNSFWPKDDPEDPEPPAGRNAERNFKGETRSNATHASSTDPDTRLYRKSDGQSSRLCYMGHLLMENRSALNHRKPRQDPAPRPRQRRLVLHLHRNNPQPRQTAKAIGNRISLSDDCQNPRTDVRKAPKRAAPTRAKAILRPP